MISLASVTTVTIKKAGAERVRARHAWVYRGDLTDDGGANGGEVVRVIDQRGRSQGCALFSSRSQISLRFVSFYREIDEHLWLRRLRSAAELRARVVNDTTAYRLVFGESDLLPSLIIDRYGDCFVIQTLSQGMENLKSRWVELLASEYSPRAIVERNESRVRDLEGLPRHSGVLYGEEPGTIEIKMNGLAFEIDLLRGQKTGAFLDQRENYVAAASYATGRALDCFTFQGGFALHMAKRCASVIAVDVSAPALEQAGRNASINGIGNIEFREANVFDCLRDMDDNGERFDSIVLDPPAFAKNQASVAGALRGYKEINLRALKLLNPGGTLITSTCSYHVNEEMFLNILAGAAADAGRSVQIVEKRMQARDHPVLVSMPETYYLKCLIARIE